MFDVAWSEIALILVVAFIVIGPKDIPAVLATFKDWRQKLHNLRQEFTATLNTIANEIEIEQAHQALQQEAAHINNTIRQIVDMNGKLQNTYDLSDLKPFVQQRPSAFEEQEDRGLANYSLNKETVH